MAAPKDIVEHIVSWRSALLKKGKEERTLTERGNWCPRLAEQSDRRMKYKLLPIAAHFDYALAGEKRSQLGR